MSASRYINRVGGTTDGRIGWDQHSDSGSWELGPEQQRRQHDLDCGDSSLWFGEEREGSCRDGSDRHDQREFDQRLDCSGSEHSRCASRQGSSVADANLERHIQCFVVGCGQQDCGQPPEISQAFVAHSPSATGSLQGNLARLIDDAIEALTRLDVVKLDELNRCAEGLASFYLENSERMSGTALRSIAASLHLFQSLLEATQTNLATLLRAETSELSGSYAFLKNSFATHKAPERSFYEGPRAFLNSAGDLDPRNRTIPGWSSAYVPRLDAGLEISGLSSAATQVKQS